VPPCAYHITERADEAKLPFDPYLQPRPSAGLLDYFEFGLLLGIPGFYRAQDLRLTEIAPCPPHFDGVFLSHAHREHSYNLRYLDPEIPLYLGSTTQEILQIWEDTGWVFKLGEHTRLEVFRTSQVIRIGPDSEVWPVHVDHSIPGAYGFVAVTGKGLVVYSGDLRFHGPASRLSQKFVRAAAMARPKALLLEGTRVNSERRDSEEDVFCRSVDLVKQNSGLVVVVQSPRDFDRIRTFWRVARETGRKLVVPLRTA